MGREGAELAVGRRRVVRRSCAAAEEERVKS
jgi:hypothetical protein